MCVRMYEYIYYPSSFACLDHARLSSDPYLDMLILWHIFIHMVYIMEETTKVDKQGRLVLPSRIREALDLKEGGSVTLRLDGSRVVIEPVFEELGKRANDWKRMALSLKVQPLTERVEDSWKWMSREFVRRKLGLH